MNHLHIRLCLLSIATSTVLLMGCHHDPTLPPEPEVSFNDQILPIIISNCATAGCHSGIASGDEELIPLTAYSEVMEIVQAGNAKDSDLYKRITKLSGEDAMPPGRPLSEQQIQLILVWINKGAKNN